MEERTDRFQVMPSLRNEEYEKLKESIAEQGVLVPVEKDADTGEILDGFHRMRVCEELGIEPPVMERKFKDDAEREIHALTLNLNRRQLSPRKAGETYNRLLKLEGAKRGRPTSEGEKSLTVRDLAKREGVSEATIHNRRQLARDLKGHPEVAEQVDRGEITPMEGRRRAGVVPPKEDVPKEPPRRETPTGEPTIGEIFERHGVSMDDMPRRSPEEEAFFPVQRKAREIRLWDTRKYAEACPEFEILDDAIANFEELEAWARKAVEDLKEERRKSTKLRAVE